MKRIFIVLLSISLLTACNNNPLVKKDKTEKEDRDKEDEDEDDDYKKKKKYDDDEDDEDYKKKKKIEDDDDDDRSKWSAADEQAFLSTCLTNARNAGADEQTSQNHCNCILEKIEKKYSDLDEANRKATKPELDAIEQKCLKEAKSE
ncbi:MAG: hypothetical protein WDN26_14350 [Chitinophagaceae bacterium]